MGSITFVRQPKVLASRRGTRATSTPVTTQDAADAFWAQVAGPVPACGAETDVGPSMSAYYS
jgi:hypothetical protein